ncbi:[FeFe] hydrogenase H-cluster radical SAM maturase HydE [candidate division WOR-3 bacterium]|nr:[FeFe] hydrogenase H-cluster radical SAM maturase HydE [candidate division WOR-3 bacterium]
MKKSEIIKSIGSKGNNAKNLRSKANSITEKIYGSRIFIRGIIEFSNKCIRDCTYCGIRKSIKMNRYEMDYKTIMLLIKSAVKMGYKTIVLQSGEFPVHDDMITDIIKESKKELDIVFTLSLGERDEQIFEKWRNAGAERYLIRIETTNRQLFKNLHPDDDYDARIESLKTLKKLGFETGTGVMIGLPNQTNEDLANDIIFFQKNNFDMYGVGPFLPHYLTPLKNAPITNADTIINFVALMRILTINTNIPATTSMGTLRKGLRAEILKSGANVIMPNHTPLEYREDYMLYDNKIGVQSEPDDTLKMALCDIEKAGKIASFEKGFRSRI